MQDDNFYDVINKWKTVVIFMERMIETNKHIYINMFVTLYL